MGEYKFYKYPPKNDKYIGVSNYDLFTTPEVYVNGIEHLEQIDSIYYVKYTIDSIISELRWSKIRIDKVINIAEFDSYFPEEKWELFSGKLECFLVTESIKFNEKWVYLWYNFQGDLGAEAIFKRIKSEYILLWFNIWDCNKDEAIITNSLVKGEMKTLFDKVIQTESPSKY